MKILQEMLKRVAALLVCAMLAQWVLFPACPCQWEYDVLPSESASSPPGSSIPVGGGMILTATHGGPRQVCCCAEGHLSDFQGVSPEVPTPSVPLATAAQDWSSMSLPKRSPDWRLLSGTDPPGPGDVRLHLRWQVFLI